MIDALRPESDCILIARPGAVADLNPVITESRYVLTPHTVPFERFCGVWSLVDRAWIDIPPAGELSRMNDYNSNIDIAMHVCHHQFYWDKKNENDLNNVTWQRTDYMHYVTDQVSDPVIAAGFLNSFRQAKTAPARPVRDTSTPNDRPRGPPKTPDDERVDQLREEVRKRFEKHLQKEKTQDVSSASESEQPKKKPTVPTPPHPPQRKQKGTARTVSSAAASGSKASASLTAESSARDERRNPVRGSAARRKTSTQAKELFKDAEAAKKFFTKFKQETEAIEWYQRPTGPQCCKNFHTCNAEDAMFWCHPCGFAYCLDCRVSGLACDHHIINYSSELSSEFMPDSIGSKDSPFDIGVLIDAVLAESASFGATRTEQAQTCQENYEDLVRHLKEGNKFGNSYLQSFVKHDIEDFDYAGFIYRMDGANRVPTLQEHFLNAQDEAALPILRPEVFFKYPEGRDLTEKEIERLLELFRSCLLGKRAVQGVAMRNEQNINDTQKDSYQLGILTLNLGHINRVPYIRGV